jgi:hypothetical protein
MIHRIFGSQALVEMLITVKFYRIHSGHTCEVGGKPMQQYPNWGTADEKQMRLTQD